MNSSLETFVPLQFKRKKGKLLVDGRESAHDVRIIEALVLPGPRSLHVLLCPPVARKTLAVEVDRCRRDEDLLPRADVLDTVGEVRLHLIREGAPLERLHPGNAAIEMVDEASFIGKEK